MFKKKFVSLVVFFIIGTIVLTSCVSQVEPEVIRETEIVYVEGTPVVQYVEVTPGPKEETELGPDDVVTITWWGTERGKDTAETREIHFRLARAFEDSHPNTKVAVALFPSRAFATRVLTGIAAGQGPDIWYHYWSPDIATQGFLEDLTPYLERDAIDPEEMYFPIGDIRGKYDGKYYALPRDATAYVFVYNKEVFDAAGVEYPQPGWTIEDFREKAIAITDQENNVYGVSTIDDGWFQWHPFSFNLGVDFLSLDGTQVEGYMDTPEAINAMKFILDLEAVDQVAAPDGLADQFGYDYLSGQIGMFGVTSWEYLAFIEQVDFDYGVISPPSWEEGEESISWTDSYMFYMNKDSIYKERVWEFMKFLTGPEAAQIIADSNVWTPAILEIWVESGWVDDPILGEVYAELQKPARVLNYERNQFYWDCVGGVWGVIMTGYIDEGKTDLDVIVPPLVQEAQACLDRNMASLED